MGMDTKDKPIFFDPSARRWFWVKTIFFVLLFLLVSCIGGSLISIFRTPTLINTVNFKEPSLTYVAPNYNSIGQLPGNIFNNIPTIPIKDNGNSKVNYIGFINSESISNELARSHLDKLDMVIGNWLSIEKNNASISEADPYLTRNMLEYIRSHKPQMKILVSLSDSNENKDQIKNILNNEELQENLIGNLLNYVQTKKINGVVLDFSLLNIIEPEKMISFITNLTERFHANNLSVMVTVPMIAANFPYYKTLSNTVDRIILLAFNDLPTANPAPISDLNAYLANLYEITTSIPANKMIIALGDIGYDWYEGSTMPQKISYVDVMQLAQLAHATITFVPNVFNPTFDYLDEEKTLHHVWYLDATTAFNEMAIAQPLHPYGYAITLGKEDPSIWNIFDNTNLDNRAAQSLTTIDTHQFVTKIGEESNIIKVTKNIKLGKRKIIFDEKIGMIANQSYDSYPSSYSIINFPISHAQKRVALTFDDGPNPVATPKILDILKKTKTPATFFIIGNNGNKNNILIQRELQEGHDIGNHSFTHPDISRISHIQLKLEMNGTTRMFETAIGKTTYLFRPPYGVDGSPKTYKEAIPLTLISDKGYLIIGLDVDSLDWTLPGVNNIVHNVLSQIHDDQDNIIIMHDGGGMTRDQTIAALPIIIDKLKKLGFQFVTISNLLKTNPIAQTTKITPSLENIMNNISFYVFGQIDKLVRVLFFITIILGILRFFTITVLSLYQKYFDTNPNLPVDHFSVTVIVSAYNEEKSIVPMINSLLKTRRPEKFEIMVIDDGSTDNTLKMLNDNFSQNPQIKILSQPNSGKATALNKAVALSQSDIIICFDADSLCAEDAIEKLLQPFNQANVAAVAGNLHVGNQINILTKWQALEYTSTQNLERRAFKLLNAVTVVPGAIGAWRRNVILEAGGFTYDTVTEDFDLTIKVRKLGYIIGLAPDALVVTEAPDTVRGLIRQRYRWMFGTLQVAKKHINAFFNPKYGTLGFIAIPNIFIQLFIQLVAPIMDLYLILSLLGLFLDWFYHPLVEFNQNLIVVVVSYGLYQIFDFVASYIAIVLDGHQKKSLLWWLFLQRFCYRQLVYYIVFKTIRDAIKGKEVWWGRPVRKGTVKHHVSNS